MNAIGEEVPGVSCVVWEMPWIDVYLINRHHNGIIKFYDCQLPERELLYQFSPLIIILRLATFSKHSVTIRYPINIWQVSPQLRCSDTCQIEHDSVDLSGALAKTKDPTDEITRQTNLKQIIYE